MHTGTSTRADVAAVEELNRQYIDAVRRSDRAWFDEQLDDDFRCSLPDGSLIGRERFLERAARPLDISNLEVHDVEVRIFGDIAIVHARTTFATAEGGPGSGRYTDVWWHHDGRWRVVAAHFTRSVPTSTTNGE